MDIPASEEVKDKSIDDIVVDFAGKYIKVLSPCYPDTFVKMHQTYMAGVAALWLEANPNLTHEELVKKGGEYATLWERQTGAY